MNKVESDLDWALTEAVTLTRVAGSSVLVEREEEGKRGAVVVEFRADGTILFNGVRLEVGSLGPWLGLLDAAMEQPVGQPVRDEGVGDV